ncbi:2780_t:CDS:2 [Funneliformis geosporum]|nr:2780_t:CDS:2 [Funneliformis geosporum]
MTFDDDEEVIQPEISLPEIVLNTIPNLVYLDLCGFFFGFDLYKRIEVVFLTIHSINSTTESKDQRFPDEIMNWLELNRVMSQWRPNIFDALTQLDRLGWPCFEEFCWKTGFYDNIMLIHRAK